MKHPVLSSALLLIGLAASSIAQETTATLTGTVTDQSGAVVPGAFIEVFHTEKNVLLRRVKTSSEGRYTAALLLAGRYRITASAVGFRPQQRNRVELTTGENLRVDFQLKIGAISETVEVTQSQVAVDLDNPNSSRLVSGNEVRDLAVVTRNFVSLVPLQPGISAALDTDQPYVGITTPVGGLNKTIYSINGARPEHNLWTLDGASINDRGENLYIFNFPSIDSIQEFNVVRNGYSAEFGGSLGGQISVITRSGTSQFHGNVYEFFRNDVLSANNFFNKLYNIERPPLRYNNFGFTVGGPILISRKNNDAGNKMFFFYSHEWRKAINYSTVYVDGVPTIDERKGIFSTTVCIDADPFSGNCLGETTQQIANIDPTAAAYIKDIYSNVPAPTSDNLLVYTAREVFDFRQISARVDDVFSPRYSIFARYIDDSIPTREASGLFTWGGLPGVQTTRTNAPGRGFTARFTTTPGPNWLNDGGYAYSWGAILSAPIGTLSSIVSQDIRPILPFGIRAKVPGIYFQSGSGINAFGPYHDYSRQHALYDTLTLLRGKHTIKFGVTWNHYEKEENGGAINNGWYVFIGNDANGSPSFAQQWANFLTGNAFSFTQISDDLTADVLQHAAELFVQDSYRIHPRLTLTLGLRWSLIRQPTDGNGYAASFDPSMFDPSSAPEIDFNSGDLAAGTVTPITNGIIIGGKNSPYGNAVTRQNNRCFAPRFGFAWDPLGFGKTSVRGGYGIFFDTPRIGFRETKGEPPFTSTVTFLGSNLSNPGGGLNVPNMTPQTLIGPVTNWQAPYLQQWSLDIQQQIGQKGKVDVGYYGSKGTHLIGEFDFNQPEPRAYRDAGIPAPITMGTTNLLNYVRPYLGYGPILLHSTRFNSNYNSLQAHYEQALGKDSILSANYTWSHALTDAPDAYSVPAYSGDIHAEYGPTPYDRRHIVSANYLYSIPFFQQQRGSIGRLLGGWESSGALIMQSGTPLEIVGTTTDPAGLGLLGSYYMARPDQQGNPNRNAPHRLDRWFDTSLFVEPPADRNRPGNARNGPVVGPAAFRWDASVLKNTKMGERASLQFRIEASNVLNHTNFNAVATNLLDPLFGRVLSARDARVVQLAVKINF